MKKICILLAMTLMLNASEKGGMFLGIGYLQGANTTTTTPTLGEKTEIKNDIKSYSLSYGVRTNSNNRLEISYERAEIEKTNSSKNDEIASFNINFDITIDTLRFGRVTPYFGVGGGRCEYLKNTSNTIDGKNANGYIIGYSTGFLVDIAKHLDIEIAYKQKKLTWINIANGDLEDEYRGAYTGLNFRF